ncbi:myb-like protein U isoform X2 [Planococcus citri]
MSPKMDYDEWTPLGRGDPLKNDPTFDYSPPMVGKVKYWISPLLRTPDPPIVPIKELTTETSQITATITSSSSSSSSSSSLSATSKSSQLQSPASGFKHSTESIKRFYIDFKDPSDTSYVHLMNTKFNNKFIRPSQSVQYQNHFYTPTRQPPPAPLPMLVPPPPIEPNSYSSNKPSDINSTTSLTHSWDVNKPLPTTLASMAVPPAPIAVTSSVTKTFATAKPDPSGMPVMKTELPFLKLLLDKETSESYLAMAAPTTTVKPLTPNPLITFPNNKHSHAVKPPSYLIIQGHSKVKKYGSNKIERSDEALTQDTNDIVNEPTKYELPKEIRAGRQIGVEDFLPFDGILGDSFKDFVSSQAEGSGFGAELTRVMFPSYVRSTPTPELESPRSSEQLELDDESSLE